MTFDDYKPDKCSGTADSVEPNYRIKPQNKSARLKWINFKDQEPEDGQDCLVEMKHGIVQGMWVAEDRWFTVYLWKDITFFGTRWMPIEDVQDGADA
jgi:hypothetical protein